MMHRQLNDCLTDAPADPLDHERTMAVARLLHRVIDDRTTFPSVMMKWARQIATGEVPVGEAAAALDHIAANRATIRGTGMYFGACMKRIVANNAGAEARRHA